VSPPHCAFCGTSSPDLAVGLAAAICDACVSAPHAGRPPIVVDDLDAVLALLPVLEDVL